MNTDSVGATLVMAVTVALACSALVSGAVYLLRPIQHAYQQVDRNRAIVEAAGLVPPGASDRSVVAAYLQLEVRLLDLATGAPGPAGGEAGRGDAALSGGRPAGLPDPRSYDPWSLSENSAAQLLVAPGAAYPAVSPRPRYLPVYLVRGEAGLEGIVLPLHGAGMWSTIYAYLALRADLDTVAALRIHRHGDTPGIGDRIEDPEWLASWAGKRVYGPDGSVQIDVVRAPSRPRHHVDAISGATVTSKGVARTVRAWMGDDGYAEMLARLRAPAPSPGSGV